MRRFIYLLTAFLSAPLAFGADMTSSKFPGFRPGQVGWGAVVGSPIGGRYQQWLSWHTAMFFDAGYDVSGYIGGSGNYSYYLLSEDDRWKFNPKVGTILYNIFGGLTAGLRVKQDREEKSRFGARAGAAIEYLVPQSDWSFRAEIAPVLYLSGTTVAGLQGGFVAMYYFDRPQTLSKVSPSRSDGGVDRESLEGGADFKEFESDGPAAAPAKKKSKKKKPKKRRKKPAPPADADDAPLDL